VSAWQAGPETIDPGGGRAGAEAGIKFKNPQRATNPFRHDSTQEEQFVDRQAVIEITKSVISGASFPRSK
jgi:hypothetical protein